MTVIAWDGKTLAADRLSQANYVASTTLKIAKLRGHLVGCAGGGVSTEEFKSWFSQGALVETFPHCLRDKDIPAIALVITPDGRTLLYENSPHPMEFFQPFSAIGSGREYALTAMHLGFDAKVGVSCASALSTSCGMGVDTLTFDEA